MGWINWSDSFKAFFCYYPAMLCDVSWTYVIFFRWLHVFCACLLVGSVFVAAHVLASRGQEVAPLSGGKPRFKLKMLVHASILLLLVSGTINAIWNWPAYHRGIPLTHALFGPHVLGAVIVIVILLVTLAGREARPSQGLWLRVAVIVLALTVLMASSLKYAREHAPPQNSSTRQP